MKETANTKNRTFHPRSVVLLTGAGFSKPFGGYLATEMWSVIFSQPECQRYRELREHLLNQLDYEMAYSEVMNGEKFPSKIKSDFTIAIERSYQQMHEAFYGDGVRIKATGVCRSIVGPFGGSGSSERGFVFTLNQDLFMERFFTNGSHSLFEICIPGINNFGCFNYTLPKRRTEEYNFQLPTQDTVKKLQAEFWDEKAYGRFVYLKLHGSFWWKSADGSNAMVIGSEKSGLIDREPYLRWSHSVFEEVLKGPGRKLVVIGYGFGDKHINKIIANAIRQHELELYVISPQLPEDFRNRLIPLHLQGTLGKLYDGQEGQLLWEGLHGYYRCGVEDLYIRNTGRLTPLGESMFKTVGL